MPNSQIRQFRLDLAKNPSRVYSETREYIDMNLHVLGKISPGGKEAKRLTRTTLEAGQLLNQAKEKLCVTREKANYPIIISS